MGSEQSSPGGREGREKTNPAAVLQSPTTAALREGASSPRQDSVCSDSGDVPYVSYTVNKPIGDSPKKVALTRAGRFTSPRLSRSLRSGRLGQSQHNTIVTVNKAVGEAAKTDLDLVKLAEIPSFVPIMQAGADTGDILSRLDHAPLAAMLQRYEDQLRVCATRVAAEQGNINRLVREVDTGLADITSKMVERQKKYEKHSEKLAGVREISRSLAKCHMLLNENIDMMDALNNSLPLDLRLEPFVWTTG